ILPYLSRLFTQLSVHPLPFALSTTSLSPLVATLTSSSSIGYLSSAAHPAAHIACSLAFLRRDDTTPICSDITGRPENQVGRSGAIRKKGDEERKRTWVWKEFGVAALPAALRKLRQANVHTIVTRTDIAQGLNRALLSFAHATQVSLSRRPSTPFVTGWPHTLIFNGSVKPSGTVGLTLSGSPRTVTQTAFPGLQAPRHNHATQSNTVHPPSKGNIINELDTANTTALLASAVEKSTLARDTAEDDEFYLGVLRDGKLWQLHHIMVGGPSRGTMALETETAPGVGTCVQLFHRPARHDIALAAGVLRKNTLAFVASSQVSNDAAALLEERDDDDVTVLEDTFVAASENGSLLRRGNEAAWTCVAPGAQVCLTW
ncbi:hypothetical protein V8E53_013568, partial [Lactarius tabidus]